jgi:death on curing protein
VRYLNLAEAFVIAEAVTGIDADTLVPASRSDLLDSALHAPQAGFGDTDFYPSLLDKAAVLCVRIASNHPLPDGTKRLAWLAMVVFLELNGSSLDVTEDDAVEMMLSVAAGDTKEDQLTTWLRARVSALVDE